MSEPKKLTLPGPIASQPASKNSDSESPAPLGEPLNPFEGDPCPKPGPKDESGPVTPLEYLAEHTGLPVGEFPVAYCLVRTSTGYVPVELRGVTALSAGVADPNGVRSRLAPEHRRAALKRVLRGVTRRTMRSHTGWQGE